MNKLWTISFRLNSKEYKEINKKVKKSGYTNRTIWIKNLLLKHKQTKIKSTSLGIKANRRSFYCKERLWKKVVKIANLKGVSASQLISDYIIKEIGKLK